MPLRRSDRAAPGRRRVTAPSITPRPAQARPIRYPARAAMPPVDITRTSILGTQFLKESTLFCRSENPRYVCPAEPRRGARRQWSESAALRDWTRTLYRAAHHDNCLILGANPAPMHWGLSTPAPDPACPRSAALYPAAVGVHPIARAGAFSRGVGRPGPRGLTHAHCRGPRPCVSLRSQTPWRCARQGARRSHKPLACAGVPAAAR